MKMSGSQVIQAPRKTVWHGLNDPKIWHGLNDPKILQQCIPGRETIKTDIKAPESHRISGKGQGGLVDFATGGATVKLTENNPLETLMDFDVDAQIGGKLAMLGSRLIG
jgi:carbon monoxide dehydrogenase subunit G